MSVRRYDVGRALAPVIQTYLENKLDPALQKVSPVVCIIDPMAIDEANRYVVDVKGWTTQPETRTNWLATIKTTAKSRWSQASWQKDTDAHYDRFNWMVDVLLSNTLLVDLNTIAAAPAVDGAGGGGLVLDFIQPRAEYADDIRENGWIYSEMTWKCNGFFPA